MFLNTLYHMPACNKCESTPVPVTTSPAFPFFVSLKMTVSGLKRSVDDMQVDSDFLTETTGTSIIQSVNECVRRECAQYNFLTLSLL